MVVIDIMPGEVVGSGVFASVSINARGNAVKRYRDDVDHAILEINVLSNLCDQWKARSSLNTPHDDCFDVQRFPSLISFDIDYIKQRAVVEMTNCGIDLQTIMHMDAFKHVTPSVKVHLFRETLFALHVLHTSGWVHCDVKPNNIMVACSRNDLTKKKINQTLTKSRVYLIDFNKCEPINLKLKSTSKCTIHYCPPEIMLGNRAWNESLDVWSAACVFGEMLKGSDLWDIYNHQGAIDSESGSDRDSESDSDSGSDSESGSSYFSYSSDRVAELAALHLFQQIIGENDYVMGRFANELYPGGRLIGTLGTAHTTPHATAAPLGFAALGIHEKFIPLMTSIFQWDISKRPSIPEITQTLTALK